MKHPEADRLARDLARLRGTGLTDAVHHALGLALAAEKAKTSLPDVAAGFARELRAMMAAAGTAKND